MNSEDLKDEFDEFSTLYYIDYFVKKVNQIDFECEYEILEAKNDEEKITHLNKIRTDLIDEINSVEKDVLARYRNLEKEFDSGTELGLEQKLRNEIKNKIENEIEHEIENQINGETKGAIEGDINEEIKGTIKYKILEPTVETEPLVEVEIQPLKRATTQSSNE